MEKDKKKKSSGKEKSSSSKEKKEKDSKHEKDDKSKKKSSSRITSSKVKAEDSVDHLPSIAVIPESKIEIPEHDPSPGLPTFSMGHVQHKPRLCVYHNEELKFYNESYQEPVCIQCTIQGPHNSHVNHFYK
jgi:hypothetical protein